MTTGSLHARRRLRRLRTQSWPILETAAAAVASWYLARLVLDGEETAFASIAAVICLGATMGQQRQRALELSAGVVVGVVVADALVRVLGTGPPLVGLMIVLAMAGAVLLGGGPLLMTEAGVSAIIIGSTPPATLGLIPTRPIEALIGGAVAFCLHSLVFPPDPLLHVSRAGHLLLGGLGRALEAVADALAAGDRGQAEAALVRARDLDGDVRALNEALALGRDTARSAPVRRQARSVLERQEEMARHLDFAVRNTRVLARDVLRHLRRSASPEPDLAAAVGDLARAVWALSAAFDATGDADEARRLALRAAAGAGETIRRHDAFTLDEIAGQVRSTAADLIRAAATGMADGTPAAETDTEELLVDPP